LECFASWTAVALLSSAAGGAFFWASLGLGGAGGGAGGGAIFSQLLGGRGPLGLPEGPNMPKNGSLWAAGGSEISSRRADRATT
jgi:hypothetical protein